MTLTLRHKIPAVSATGRFFRIYATVVAGRIESVAITETDMEGTYGFGAVSVPGFKALLEQAGQSWGDILARIHNAAARRAA